MLSARANGVPIRVCVCMSGLKLLAHVPTCVCARTYIEDLRVSTCVYVRDLHVSTCVYVRMSDLKLLVHVAQRKHALREFLIQLRLLVKTCIHTCSCHPFFSLFVFLSAPQPSPCNPTPTLISPLFSPSFSFEKKKRKEDKKCFFHKARGNGFPLPLNPSPSRCNPTPTTSAATPPRCHAATHSQPNGVANSYICP